MQKFQDMESDKHNALFAHYETCLITEEELSELELDEVEEDSLRKVMMRRCTAAVTIAQYNEDAMSTTLAIGESVCSPIDNFSKRRGRDIALGRASCVRESAEGLVTFISVKDLIEGKAYTPLTHSPIPIGLIKRIDRLVAGITITDGLLKQIIDSHPVVLENLA